MRVATHSAAAFTRSRIRKKPIAGTTLPDCELPVKLRSNRHRWEQRRRNQKMVPLPPPDLAICAYIADQNSKNYLHVWTALARSSGDDHGVCFSPAADMPAHTLSAAMCQEATYAVQQKSITRSPRLRGRAAPPFTSNSSALAVFRFITSSNLGTWRAWRLLN
jgi:hypothetical protein